MIYITGDTHAEFNRVEEFCLKMNSSREDILIVLGDAGINYFGNNKDKRLKQRLSEIPITLFCIHGNHEMRPATIDSYTEITWNSGMVYAEPDYPSLIFAKDGEIYNLEGKQCIVIGGAYSVDKYYRLKNHWGWWPDEQPSQEIKDRVERILDSKKWIVDIVLSHTCPAKYIPTEVFLSFIDQSSVDSSCEEWLDKIEQKLTYSRWYCGHYHTNKKIDRMIFLFESFMEFALY